MIFLLRRLWRPRASVAKCRIIAYSFDCLQRGQTRLRPEPDGPLQPRQQASSQKRKLAAILHADVVAFSRLMGEDDTGTHQALGRLRQAVDPLIIAQNGRIVGTAGDSLLADFSSVVDALNCAVEMQQAAQCHQRTNPARTSSRATDRCQSGRRHRRWGQHFWRWHQHRRPAPGARQAWHDLHFSDRLRAGEEQAQFPLPLTR